MKKLEVMQRKIAMKRSLCRAGNKPKPCSWLLLIFVLFSTFSIKGMAQTRSAESADLYSKSERRGQASITHKPNFPVVGEMVEFVDSSTDQSSSWQWDFGDGKTSNVRNPRHFYSKPGFYSVTLTMDGSFGKKRVRRTIGVMPPTDASFSYSPASPKIGQRVQFTDKTSGSPTFWLWRFGDGTTSTARNARHAYRAAGTYTVTMLTGTLSGVERESRTLTVSAAAPPPVSPLSSSFTFSPGSPAPGQAVHFTDKSAGAPTSWQWDFNDGSTSTVQNPNHTFKTAGTYNVTLTITNGTGSGSISVGILVGLVEAIRAASPSLADVSSAVSSWGYCYCSCRFGNLGGSARH
jgi:PKD repeat protein